MAKITVQNTEITVLSHDDKDYISLTDMANGKQSESRAADVIKNWIRTRYTIEFLGTWEMIHNPNFKVVEFDHFRMQAGLPSFVMSVSEWIKKTNANSCYDILLNTLKVFDDSPAIQDSLLTFADRNVYWTDPRKQ